MTVDLDWYCSIVGNFENFDSPGVKHRLNKLCTRYL